ncbi:hypothetical protein QQS21_004733 [Conoideocrella luteorostrata]|uniref:Uncharacterized protein n=1 Tax=Conoideocrella luteorostrata TaxID=1105319 RepID=A0AAJ0CTB4_9HYPO|nr:hypothetical protein QQS21_004733 [Conoideocrella luteorostrata]
MNLGPAAKVPTYHVAPNFTTRPDGPHDLGTLVEDLVQYFPINQGSANPVPIPDGQRYTDVKQDVVANPKDSVSGEGSILAKALGRSIGGDASLKGKRMNEDVYSIKKLETIYFSSRPSYISKCLQLQDIKDYNETADSKEHMYLITGP